MEIGQKILFLGETKTRHQTCQTSQVESQDTE